MNRTDYTKMPLEAIMIGQEVTRFYLASKWLGLVNPKTGLNFEDYSLAIFHRELEVKDVSGGDAWVHKPATIYATLRTEVFKKHLVDEKGEFIPDAPVPLEELTNFIVLYDEHLLPGEDNGDFLKPDMLTKERDIKFSLSMNGVQNLQRYIFKQNFAMEFAIRINRNIWRLDFPTDASSAQSAASIIDRIRSKE
jgi:hypothetical protein